MGLAYIEGAGGGGVRSSDVTATAADILTGKYDLTAQSDDEVVQGTMPNNGTVNHTLPINGSFTIAQGYHSGSGKVTQSITTKAAATYYATTSDQTISAGQYLSGAQTIKKLTATNLTGANIKPGVTISVNNGNANVWSVAGTMTSKAAATYYPSTSDQTISAGQYLSGAQTIKAVSQQNLTAANIKKGVTVLIKNGSGNIYSVTGTWEGYVPANTDLYYRGTYGQYGTLNFYTYGSTATYVKRDSGQITFNTNTASGGTNIIRFAFVTPVAVNMSAFTKLYLEGSVTLGLSGSTQYTCSAQMYIDLLDSNPSSDDALNENKYSMRLASRTQTGTGGNLFTWGNNTFSWSKQNVTKYLRVYFNLSRDTGSDYLVANGAWYRMQLQS